MADLLLPEDAAALGHHVVRRPPRGLVDDDEAVRHMDDWQRNSRSAALTLPMTSTTGYGAVNPAANRCPPPPKRAAMALTSTSSDTERNDTRMPSRVSL